MADITHSSPLKKVLVITYYWPPAGGSGVQRWVKFVKYFRDFGWEPVVFTIKDGEYSLLDESLLKDIPEGVEVLKVPAWEPHKLYMKLFGNKKGEKIHQNFLSGGKKWTWKEAVGVFIRGNFFIPDARMFWIRPSVNFITDYIKQHKIDAIVSSGPPHSCHVIALKVKEKTNIPWIADFRDPWTGIDYFDDLMLTPLSKLFHKRLEQKVLNQCNTIVAVGESNKRDYQLLTQNTIEVIPNGYDIEIATGQSFQELDKEFTITYLGAMNASRNPEVLWKAIQLLIKENSAVLENLKVKLVGSIEAKIFESIEEHGVGKYVSHTSYVPYAEALKLQNQAQLLLIVINNTYNKSTIVPGKIYENIASLRPIICIGPKDGDTAKIIDTTASGAVVEYDDVPFMKQTLEKYYHQYLNKALVNEPNENIQKYSRKALTERMSSLLNKITQQP